MNFYLASNIIVELKAGVNYLFRVEIKENNNLSNENSNFKSNCIKLHLN